MLIKIRGISARAEKIWQLEGVQETERLPQFVAWTEKPSPGHHLTATNNLISSPYAVRRAPQNAPRLITPANPDTIHVFFFPPQAARPAPRRPDHL